MADTYPTSIEGDGSTKSVGLSRLHCCCSDSEPEISWFNLLWLVSSTLPPSIAPVTALIEKPPLVCQISSRVINLVY